MDNKELKRIPATSSLHIAGDGSIESSIRFMDGQMIRDLAERRKRCPNPEELSTQWPLIHVRPDGTTRIATEEDKRRYRKAQRAAYRKFLVEREKGNLLPVEPLPDTPSSKEEQSKELDQNGIWNPTYLPTRSRSPIRRRNRTSTPSSSPPREELSPLEYWKKRCETNLMMATNIVGKALTHGYETIRSHPSSGCHCKHTYVFKDCPVHEGKIISKQKHEKKSEQ